jgi:hypothetical protein
MPEVFSTPKHHTQEEELMEALRLTRSARPHPYACRALDVSPNPPEVGKVTTISLALENPEPAPLTVNRIELRIARFGMGVAWEELPPLGPFQLPADPNHIEHVRTEWTPTDGGHRCVRGTISVEGLTQPLRVGMNLHVIESAAERTHWRIPFRVGNPEPERQPLVLQVAGNPDLVEARLMVGRRPIQPGDPLMLEGGEEREAMLLLHATTEEALEAVNTVEAFLGGRFLDGIQVEVHRPARITSHHPELLPPEMAVEPAVLALVR